MGELLAWMVGWALILEYAVAASAFSVGWSGYFVGLLASSLGIVIPTDFANGPDAGGIVNIPAFIIALLVTWLLLIGTRESAAVNAVLVTIKVAALTAFIRSEEHTSDLQSLMRTSYAVFCLKKKNYNT